MSICKKHFKTLCANRDACFLEHRVLIYFSGIDYDHVLGSTPDEGHRSFHLIDFELLYRKTVPVIQLNNVNNRSASLRHDKRRG